MTCKIVLSNYYGHYLAGSTIEGTVICEFTSTETIRGISVKLKGVEKVYWTEGEDSYSKKNKFLVDERTIGSRGSTRPGRFDYPFAFTLPPNIPTSYDGKHGWITYTIKAKVDVPMAFDYKDKIKFRVILPLDLNKLLDKAVLRPCTNSLEKTVSCCCFPSGHINMEVDLDKRAFVPGEAIKIGVRIKNTSNEDVEEVKAKLQMTVECAIPHCLGHNSKKDITTVAKTRQNGFSAALREKFYELILELPTFDAVPNFYNCDLLSLKSELKVVGVLSMFHFNMVVNVPIMLADIQIGGQEAYHRKMQGEAMSIHTTRAAFKIMGLYKD